MQALQTVNENQTIDFFASIQDNYSYHIRDFLRWTGDREIGFASIRDYFVFLNEESGFKPNTIRIKRAAVKKRMMQLAYNLSGEERARIKDFFDVMDNCGETSAPKIASAAISKEKFLNKGEVAELLAAAITPRQWCYIQFLWVTGCRINELTGIKLSNIKTTENVAYIENIQGKGRKFREVKIPLELYNKIRDTFRGEIYLFETSGGKRYQNSYISNQIKKIGKKHLRKDISAHTMRHSFASWKIKKGVQLSYVSKYMGHSSISVTADMYDHGAIEESDLMSDYIS